MKAQVTHPRYTSFLFRLLPTEAQEKLCFSYAGAARFTKNQCRAQLLDAYDRRKADARVKLPRSREDFINLFNAWKVSPAAGIDAQGRPGLPWRDEVLAQVFEEAAVDFSHALKRFHESKAGKLAGPKVGFPKKKKKGRTPLRFRLRNKICYDKVTQVERTHPIRFVRGKPRQLVVPGLGKIALATCTRLLRRLLRPNAHHDVQNRILFVTFEHTDAKWYVRIQVGVQRLHASRRVPAHPNPLVTGGDLGLKAFLTTANEEGGDAHTVLAPKPFVAGQKKVSKLNRALARKREAAKKRLKDAPPPAARNDNETPWAGYCRSRRYQKQLKAYTHHCAVTARQRDNFLHACSSNLVKSHDLIALETLCIRGLLKNHKLALHIADAAWGKFVHQVEYKCDWLNRQFVKVARNFPSSKQCSRCNWKNAELTLKDRVFVCQACGLQIDRDRNAAINIAREGRRLLAAMQADRVNDHGEGSAGPRESGGETTFCEVVRAERPTSPEKGAVDAHLT